MRLSHVVPAALMTFMLSAAFTFGQNSMMSTNNSNGNATTMMSANPISNAATHNPTNGGITTNTHRAVEAATDLVLAGWGT